MSDWTGPRSGPWPRVETQGMLERAEREWLHTNGAGAYAMSTLALMHTRRHHGMLVASLDPPERRYVVLNHAETSVEVAGRTHRLSTHQFPNVAPTPGYRLLSQFSQDPIPRWEYRIGKSRFERTLCLVRGKNAVVLGYTWHGRKRARLMVRPLISLRPVDELTREHGAMVQRATLRQGEVEIQPRPELPPVIFRHSGVFVGSPDWWRRFEYLSDRELMEDFQEDLWTPGTFDLWLEPGDTTYLVASLGELPSESAEELTRQAVEHLNAQDPGAERLPIVRSLSIAADSFCADACDRPTILAGYPYFEARSRDAALGLSGLYLARGKVREAKAALGTLLGAQRGGLLPDAVLGRTARRGVFLPDATLWLFDAARQLLRFTGSDDEFVRQRLFPALRRAFVRLQRGHSRWARITAEGLLASVVEEHPLTWMDARQGAWQVTPRNGLPVELQALWHLASDTMALLARAFEDAPLARAADQALDKVQAAFRSRFWCNETDYPFDCISAEQDTADAWADPSVRPNAVIALAIAPDLFERWQAEAIVGRAKRDLLTVRGLRSLGPDDAHYHGYYEGPIEERGGSYHQGTAWAYLLGYYVRAAHRLAPSDYELRDELVRRISAATDRGLVLGHVSQLSDGDEPFRPRGCPAQAWSVGELLRALVFDLGE